MDETPLIPPQSLEEVDVAPLHGEIGFLVRMAQLRVFNYFYQGAQEAGLRPGGYSVLWVIHRNPGIRQGLLAQRLLIKPAHMAKLVRRFEDRGLVARRVPEDDRRALELFLTPDGETYLRQNESFFFDFMNTLPTHLSAAEQREFVRLLQKFNGLEPLPGSTPQSVIGERS